MSQLLSLKIDALDNKKKILGNMYLERDLNMISFFAFENGVNVNKWQILDFVKKFKKIK